MAKMNIPLDLKKQMTWKAEGFGDQRLQKKGMSFAGNILFQGVRRRPERNTEAKAVLQSGQGSKQRPSHPWLNMLYAPAQRKCQQDGDTLDYLGIPGLHIAGAQGVLVIAICQFLLMWGQASWGLAWGMPLSLVAPMLANVDWCASMLGKLTQDLVALQLDSKGEGFLWFPKTLGMDDPKVLDTNENPDKKPQKIKGKLTKLEFQNPERFYWKVDDQGCVNFGKLLKVTSHYDSRGCSVVSSNTQMLIEEQFCFLAGEINIISSIPEQRQARIMPKNVEIIDDSGNTNTDIHRHSYLHNKARIQATVIKTVGIALALLEGLISAAVAGVRVGLLAKAILLIEGYSDFLTKELLLQVVDIGHDVVRAIYKEVEFFVNKSGTNKMDEVIRIPPPECYEQVEELVESGLIEALQIRSSGVKSLEQCDFQYPYLQQLCATSESSSGIFSSSTGGSFGLASMSVGAHLMNSVNHCLT
eukprot:Gb_21132 [translate_table: standard]